jgi:hypothetical protein
LLGQVTNREQCRQLRTDETMIRETYCPVAEVRPERAQIAEESHFVG